MKKMVKRLVISLILCCFGCVMPLQAEIEYIVVKWLPTACLGPCAQGIAQQFLSIYAIAEVIVNQAQGQATLRWKPRVPFSYDYINTAMRLVGPNVQDVRIRVRGTIIVTPNAVLLQSIGDETQFVLLSPAIINLNQYTPKNNINMHILSPEVRQNFIDGQRDSTVVVVEGPLFEPQRMQGLYLIVQSATFNRLKRN